MKQQLNIFIEKPLINHIRSQDLSASEYLAILIKADKNTVSTMDLMVQNVQKELDNISLDPVDAKSFISHCLQTGYQHLERFNSKH